LVLLAQQAQQDPQVQKAILEIPDQLAQQGPKETQAQQGPKETQAQQDPQVQKAILEILAQLAQPGQQAPPALMVLMVHQGQPVLLDQQALQDQQVLLEVLLQTPTHKLTHWALVQLPVVLQAKYAPLIMSFPTLRLIVI
jgi:hypothetical protein